MTNNRIKRVLAWGLLVLGISTLVAMPAQAETWIKAESENFTVYSSAPEKTTRGYVKKLEVFRNLTNLLLGSGDTGPKVRFEIYLLKNRDDIQVVRPDFSNKVAGVYFNCGEGTSAYGTAPGDGASEGNVDESLVILFHEYSHYIMFQHARSFYPAWYIEGFAEYMSTADPTKGKITVGEPSIIRGWTLAEDRWIGFDKILNPSFGFAGDKSNRDWDVERFYAQSWLLTHYMLSDPKRARDLNTYFAGVGNGADPIASFEESTGIKVNQLSSILKRYRASMSYLSIPIPDYPENKIQVTKLNPSTSAYLLDRSLLTTCMRPEQGKAVLARLEKLKGDFASDITYQSALARAHLLFGKAEDAEAIIGPIVQKNPEDFEANYLMGRVYYQMGQAASGQDRTDYTDASRSFFMNAYQINKLNAPNLYFFSQSYESQPDYPNTNALNAANGAHVLAPSVREYAVYAAYVNLAKDKRPEAIALLTPFVSNPHDRESALRFQKAIDAIKEGKSAQEVMSTLN